jgi:hypothetical protein
MTREQNLARSAECKDLCPEKPAWKGGYLLSPYAINENCTYKKNWEACNKKKTPIKNGPIPDAKNCDKKGEDPAIEKEDPDKCPKEGLLRSENIERAKKCLNLCKERSKSGTMGAITGFDSIKKNCDYKNAYEACDKKKTPIKNGPVPNADACKPPPGPEPTKDDKGCPSTGVTRSENLQRAHDCTTLCKEKGKPGGPLMSFDSIKMDCNYLNYYNNCKYSKGKGTPIPNGPKPDSEACTQRPTGECPKTGMTRD